MNDSPTAAPVRAVLFDIGNVLLRFDFLPALRRIAADCETLDPVEAMGRIDQIKAGYEDGQIDHASFVRGVCDAIRYHGTEADFVAAWEDIFEPNLPVIALVEQLHGKLPLFLLSNTGAIHRDYIFRRYDFFRLFSGGVYSYEAQASKPGRKIFEIALRRLSLKAETTYFIDDLLPNIETARSLGFRCHHYHHERHAELLADLESVGVGLPSDQRSDAASDLV